MTIDQRSLHAVIVPALERCLAAIATDRECSPQELSFHVYRALETYGLECIRAAEQIAAAAEQIVAAERGTGVMRRVTSAAAHVNGRKRMSSAK